MLARLLLHAQLDLRLLLDSFSFLSPFVLKWVARKAPRVVAADGLRFHAIHVVVSVKGCGLAGPLMLHVATVAGEDRSMALVT